MSSSLNGIKKTISGRSHPPETKRYPLPSQHELLLFVTMLKGPRITADDVTPSCGLFLTCKGENITVLHNGITDSIYV